MRTVRSGRSDLAVERLGDGPCAVALHAGVADRRSWAPLAALLSGTLGLVAYDRRGFGETTYDPEPFRHVDDLARVLDAVAGPSPTWLVGNSQGGRIAVDFALAAPERVAGLVLIAPALTGEAAEPALDAPTAALDAAISAADARDDLDEVNRLEAHLWLDGPSATEGRVGGWPRELFLDMNGRALRATDPGTELPPPVSDAARRLADLDRPVLVLCGDLDLAPVRARSEQIAAEAPAARLSVLAGCAHLPQLERPRPVAAGIRAFLGAATPGG